MEQKTIDIREAHFSEFHEIGELMVLVYSQLQGFPSKLEQPLYYNMLLNVGDFTNKPNAKLLVAVSLEHKIYGAVVYFGDMAYYGSGGTATKAKNTAGFRLLAVDPKFRGNNLGKRLTQTCIDLAKTENKKQLVIHTTKAMQTAWKMYEKFGFIRAEEYDFLQSGFPVFGFKLSL